MATAEQLGAFNSAVASGDFAGAAAIAASAGYSPADVAAYVNENAAGLGLGPETGFQGVDPAGIAALYPTPSASYGPPSPAVSPVVSNPISLTPAGIASLAPSANVSSPANVFSPADYGPPSPPPAAPEPVPAAVNPVDQQAGGLLNQYYAAIDAGDIRTARNLLSQAQAIYGPETLTNVAQDMLSRLNQTITQAKTTGDFTGAAKLVEAADQIYGGDALQNIADYLNTDLQLLDANKGARFTPQNLVQFIQQGKIPAAQATPATPAAPVTPVTPVTPEGAAAVPTVQTTPGPGQIAGIPRFERQTQSSAAFAPLRRGLAQLRPAMYMPGLTSGQAPLGGSGFTPEQLQQASTRITQEGEAAGKTQEQILADFASLMDVGGVSPAELAAATARAPGELQGLYNQSRPRGLFSTAPTTPFALPEDFVLQTGAYGAPTPTFLARPEKAAPLPTDPKPLTDFTKNPIVGYTEDRTPIYAPNPADDGGGARAGGIIKMAEGGMPRLSAEEAGSTFDIADYIDEQGRLVGGYSKPIYDENRVITGYDYRPYERDVVFGKELRDKEAAMRPTDAEREQMMVEMAMRQGRTGISPTRGGLAGIEIGDPMMRRRPQYYSTVEESRPRYAEGGLASVAQDLASKGRGGDSMLVHMAPHEVAGLNAIARMQGTELTINPETGMPEALKLGKLFKMLAPMALGFALGPAGFGGGIFKSALSAGLAVGAGYTLATGSLQQGISAGLGAYGGANLGTGLQAAGTADAVGQAAASEAAQGAVNVAPNLGGGAAQSALVDGSNAFAFDPVSGEQIISGAGGATSSVGADFSNLSGIDLAGAQNPALTSNTALVDSAFTPTNLTGDVTSNLQPTVSELAEIRATGTDPYYGTYSDATGGIQTPSRVSVAPDVPPTPGSALTGAERYFGDKATRDLAAERYADATGSTLGTSAMQIAGSAAGQSAADAEQAMKTQQAAINAKQDERKRRFDALFGRTLGAMPARSGGLMKLAGGGMTYMEAGGTTGPTGAPRDVTGTGDGMSDSVPASIEGVQEARLADGEFVIPADVVADIGNGSSDAGSKKLYDMMDRIRKARHGTTEQPPEIQAERLMPA